MDHITQIERDFMIRLDSKECERYWAKDENGERVIMRSGCDKAQIEYDRIKESLVVNSQTDLKE